MNIVLAEAVGLLLALGRVVDAEAGAARAAGGEARTPAGGGGRSVAEVLGVYYCYNHGITLHYSRSPYVHLYLYIYIYI